MSKSEVDLIVIRHSERLDEVDAIAWKRAVDQNKERPSFKYDPLISSKRGVEYAREVAATLKVLTASESRPIVVFASKLLRATQTASYIAHELGVAVHLSAGLAQIIPAVKNVGEGFEFAGLSELQRCCCPEVDFVDCDHPSSPYCIPRGSWRAATAEIIRKSQQEGCLPIIVAHRESIRKIAGEHLQTPHCCVGMFRLEGNSTSLRAEEKDSAPGERASSCKGRSDSTEGTVETDFKSEDKGADFNHPREVSNRVELSQPSSGSGKAAPAPSAAAAPRSAPTGQATAGRMSRVAAGSAAAGGIVRCGTKDPAGHKPDSARPLLGSDRPRAGAGIVRGEAKRADGTAGAGKLGRNEVLAQLRLITVLDRDGSTVPQK